MDKDNLLSRYSEACQDVAREYVGRSSRFGAVDLRVLESLPETRRFKTNIRYSLEVISEAKDVQGEIPPGDDDFSTVDWSWYQERVQQQAQSELARKETLEELVAAVKSQPYAAIFEKTCVRSHPSRLFHSYICGTCHGSGQITCYRCNGSGRVVCSSCGGSGHTSCSRCGGSGSVSEQHQVRDYSGHYRTETRYRACYSCSGGRVTCSYCGGSGRNTCRVCSGSGLVVCGTCAGHGNMTRITSTSTYTVPEFSGLYPTGTPDYVSEVVRKAGFLNLEQYGVIEFEDANMLPEHARVNIVYSSTIYFCELFMEIAGHQSTWVLYGSPPRIYDTGGILEILLKDDLVRLDALGKEWGRMLPWFYRRARGIVAPFMASEIHQEIVNADYQGLAPEAIVERVNRSLSQEYIEQSLNRLRQVIQVTATWASLKWTAVIALSSIPLIIFGSVFIERSKTHAMLATQDYLIIFPWISGTQPQPDIVFVTIPLSLSGWLFAKWVSGRWLRRTGGKPLVKWASCKGLLIGKWTAAAVIVSSVVLASWFFNKWPVWMDRNGNLYGILAVFEAPQVIEPTIILPPKKIINRHRSRKAN